MDKYLEEGDLLKKTSLQVYVLKHWHLKSNQCFVVLRSKQRCSTYVDAVIEFLPSPTEVKAIEGILDDKAETKASREASDEAIRSLRLRSKHANDKFVGNLTFVMCLFWCS